MGSAVIARGRSGSVVKARVKPRNPKTTPQTTARFSLSTSSKNFKNFVATTVTAWNNYGLTITKHNPKTGKAYTSTGINAYNSLAAKYLQINPGTIPPSTPPATAFIGDTITVTAATGTLSIIFTGSAPNGPNIKTEVLLQRLVSKNRVPNAKGYRSKGFVAYAAGSLTFPVTVASGTYVPAYRFVNTQTGQATALVILPTLTV